MTYGELACDCMEHANKSWCCARAYDILPPEYNGWMLLALAGVFCIGMIWFVLTKCGGDK